MIIVDIILNIISYLLHIYALCLVVAGLLTFVGANAYNPIVTFFRAITNPPCRMLTKKFPKLVMSTHNGYLDLSPLILLLIIGCLIIVVQKIGFYLGIYL